MAIAPISALPSLPPAAGASPLQGSLAAAGATAAGGATGSGFADVLGNAIDSLNQAQTTASTDEVRAAAGQGTLANTMIAASEASLDTQVATSLIDKALSAYTSITAMTI